jgi:hypothetical protein
MGSKTGRCVMTATIPISAAASEAHAGIYGGMSFHFASVIRAVQL